MNEESVAYIQAALESARDYIATEPFQSDEDDQSEITAHRALEHIDAALKMCETSPDDGNVKPLSGLEEHMLRERADLPEETKRVLATLTHARVVYQRMLEKANDRIEELERGICQTPCSIEVR